MDLWKARDILFTSMCGDVSLEIDLTRCRTQQGYILNGLRTGFYPGGSSAALGIYESLVQAAEVHGLWVKRSKFNAWTVFPLGNRPKGFNKELHDRYVADCLAWNLDPAHENNKVWDGYPPENDWFYAHTQTLQDRHWLQSLAAKYVDDRYRKQVEPFIKRVENGRLIVRRINGKWSIA